MDISTGVQNAWANFVRIARQELTDEHKKEIKEAVADIATYFTMHGLPKNYYSEVDFRHHLEKLTIKQLNEIIAVLIDESERLRHQGLSAPAIELDVIIQIFESEIAEKRGYSEFSECPRIPEAKEMIERTRAYFKAHPNAPLSTEMGGAEVASIGHNYTYHTHPMGTAEPSDADIQTTLRLKRQFLCIGLVPKNKVVCYDMNNGGRVSCEHPI